MSGVNGSAENANFAVSGFQSGTPSHGTENQKTEKKINTNAHLPKHSNGNQACLNKSLMAGKAVD